MAPTKFRHARFAVVAAVSAVLSGTVAGCSLESTGDDGGDAITVVVGYQSKTINTVTAGTLLRAEGHFEKRLDELSSKTGERYTVTWQDYDTGAPITTGMIAGKIDIGSMGDYPLLINGSRASANDSTRTEMLSITGSSPRGALNMVVVPKDSSFTTLADLRGKQISASVGSAGHGTLVQALDRIGIDPVAGVSVTNQQPQVGASALESGKVDALAQFVAWPGLLVFQNKARLLYDGAELGVPTLHGVVAGSRFAARHPDVVESFLRAQLDATQSLVADPLGAAQKVADGSGLPPEVVYMYNGPAGTDFNPALKPSLIAALKGDKPYLKSIGSFERDLDIDEFVNDEPLRRAVADSGQDYEAALVARTNELTIKGRDSLCNREVNSSSAAELWLAGDARTQPAADPTCLLKAVRAARDNGHTVRAAYIVDPRLGTRWFADKAVWLREGDRFFAFTTADSAAAYGSEHPGAVPVTYEAAIGQVAR